MLIVKVEKSIETALKVYKGKVQRTKQIQQLRERQSFTKPSVKKRLEISKACYIQKIKNGLD